MNFLIPSVPPVASINAWVEKKTLFAAAPATVKRPGVAELLDERPDVVRHRRDVVEVRLRRERLDLGDLWREVGRLVVIRLLEHDLPAELREARLEVLAEERGVLDALVPEEIGVPAELLEGELRP